MGGSSGGSETDASKSKSITNQGGRTAVDSQIVQRVATIPVGRWQDRDIIVVAKGLIIKDGTF